MIPYKCKYIDENGKPIKLGDTIVKKYCWPSKYKVVVWDEDYKLEGRMSSKRNEFVITSFDKNALSNNPNSVVGVIDDTL